MVKYKVHMTNGRIIDLEIQEGKWLEFQELLARGPYVKINDKNISAIINTQQIVLIEHVTVTEEGK